MEHCTNFDHTRPSHPPPFSGPSSRGLWGRDRGRGILRREEVIKDVQGKNTFKFDEIVEKFDELEVIEESFEIAKNSGINFDAYNEIPVKVSGENVPKPVKSFAEIDLGDSLNENITRCGYVKPTPIQCHAIPIAMYGRDLMACAQTGSGKTAAFCLPIIARVSRRVMPYRLPSHCGDRRIVSPVALILSPTRELASQISEEAKKFANHTGVKVGVVYGGSSMFDQLRRLERGVDILVATPGRLVDMIEREKVSLRMVRYLTLDEADRMLDMGFGPQIRTIVEDSGMPPPGRRQTMLFSATFPTQIQMLASDFLSNYIFLTIGRVGSSTDLISQKVEFVYDIDKKQHLKNLLLSQTINGAYDKELLTLVFVETKRRADELEEWLSHNDFPAISIHGDKVQMERERALRSFKTGATPIMVATDVASRGLDIPSVAHVINFDLPRDIDDYVHRIGRTGRAGKRGLATAFFNDKNQPLAKPLAELIEEANQVIPAWLTDYYTISDTSFGYRGPLFNGGSRNGGDSRGSKFGAQDYRRFDRGNANYGGGGDGQSGQGFAISDSYSANGDGGQNGQGFVTSDSYSIGGGGQNAQGHATSDYSTNGGGGQSGQGFATSGSYIGDYDSIVPSGWD